MLLLIFCGVWERKTNRSRSCLGGTSRNNFTGVNDMNINIKNCEVNIITGKDTLEINGGTQPAAAAEGVISTQHTYSVAGFTANRDKVKIGDCVKLPAFTVPSVKMDGDEVMEF